MAIPNTRSVMVRRAWDEADTAENSGARQQVSGVHAATTAPAPDLEVHEARGRLVGSIPLDALRVDFQPIVDLRTGEVDGYEAQASCPEHGLRDREDLIARAALEKKLGELGRAIRAIATRECPHTTLYLALHPAELREGLILQPDDPVFSHAAPLRLQLSQPALPAVAQAVLRELSSRSTAELVIDDFGAGAGTLKQWVELSPRAVKIDAELIAGLDRSRRKQSAVRALVGLAHELGTQLIAKGVDCADEARAAVDCGLRYGQGFALGEPSPLPAISIWPKR